MFKIQIDTFTDDPGVLGDRWSYQIWSQFENRIIVELCLESFTRQLDAITSDAWKTNFQFVTIWTDCLDLNCFAWWLRRRYDRFGSEVEWNTQHVCILDVEKIFFIQFVGLTSQRTPDHLFTKQLSTKCSHAQHMRYSVSVPTLGQHRNWHNATNRIA